MRGEHEAQSISLLIAFAAAPAAFAVTIDPVNYLGRYFLGAAEYHGKQNIPLGDGTYSIDDSAHVGGSAISFTVTGGVINSVTPAAAATTDGTTLSFFNTTVTIDPRSYAGTWFFGSFGTGPVPDSFQGKQSFVLIPGLAFTGDAGSQVGGSAFGFSLDGSGNILGVIPAGVGQASGATLTLNNVTVTVDPGPYPAVYVINPFRTGPPLRGKQSLVLIPALQYTGDDGAQVGTSAFAFTLDPSRYAILLRNTSRFVDAKTV